VKGEIQKGSRVKGDLCSDILSRLCACACVPQSGGLEKGWTPMKIWGKKANQLILILAFNWSGLDPRD